MVVRYSPNYLNIICCRTQLFALSRTTFLNKSLSGLFFFNTVVVKMEHVFVNHPQFGNKRIYYNLKPVILEEDLSALLSDEEPTRSAERNQPEEQRKCRWVFHLAIYPNQETGIYNKYWRGLNGLGPGKRFSNHLLMSCRWVYIYEHTGMILSRFA